jgi:hypothetical protein
MTASTHFSSGLLTDLRTEWTESYADTEHVFGPLGSIRPGILLAKLQSRTLPKAVLDGHMHTLVLLSHRGDHVAERLLLELMTPKAIQLARTCAPLRNLSPADAVSTTLSVIWEKIRTYPEHLTETVAGNIGLNALNEITRSFGSTTEISADIDELERAMNDDPNHYGDSSFDNLVKVLSWAVDARVLTRDEVSLLATVDLGTSAERQHLADQLDVTRDTLNKRVWRIRNKLITAVREHIVSFGRWE